MLVTKGDDEYRYSMSVNGPKKYFVKMPSELSRVTEHKFSFSPSEQNKGIVLYPESPQSKMWDLIVNRDTGLNHPYLSKLGTIEELGRELAATYEEEIKLHADYCAIADRVAYLDEQKELGKTVNELNRPHLIRTSNIVFNNWESSRTRSRALEQTWLSYREDQVQRFSEAIKIYEDMLLQGFQVKEVSFSQNVKPSMLDDELFESIDGLAEWVPDSQFVQDLKDHILMLEDGVKMTLYYEMQSCASFSTGRPLFAPSELDRESLVVSKHTDPYWRSFGNVLQRFQLWSDTLEGGDDEIQDRRRDESVDI